MGIATEDVCYDFTLGSTTPPPLAALRRWLRKQLAGAPDRVVQDAELVATELVTNAYEHTAGVLSARLSQPAGPRLTRVEVDDASPSLMPRMAPATPGVVVRGRGLQLVKAISVAWGVTKRPGRKTVWADLATD
jgi:anti-sigma regulatory factor (Ser/Thr protein kinase)